MFSAMGVESVAFALMLGMSGEMTVPEAMRPQTCPAKDAGNRCSTHKEMRLRSPVLPATAPRANAPTMIHHPEVENVANAV